MKIAVIGVGYVGTAMVRMLTERYEVLAKDLDVEYYYKTDGTMVNIPAGKDDYSRVNACGAAVICVPTNMMKDGSCNTSILEWVVDNCTCRYILIKSTIPPGTTRRLAEKYRFSRQIAFSPEYMGESKYFTPPKYPHPTNLKSHDFQIFGGARQATNFFVELFQPIMGPNCRYFQTDSTTAEVVKYMENAWGAIKVTFANEFYRISDVFGVDYREVRELWLLDPRTERMHTCVFEGSFGYGGKCLPKDINAIIYASTDKGYVPELLMQVEKSNHKFRLCNVKEEDDAQDLS